MEDNLTSADPLSYTTNGSRVDQGAHSERLLHRTFRQVETYKRTQTLHPQRTRDNTCQQTWTYFGQNDTDTDIKLNEIASTQNQRNNPEIRDTGYGQKGHNMYNSRYLSHSYYYTLKICFEFRHRSEYSVGE